MGKCKHVLGLPNALKSICPKCGAQIGRSCHSTGKASVQPHKARRNEYRRSIFSPIPGLPEETVPHLRRDDAAERLYLGETTGED
jgi:hypothetical protein